MIIPLTGWAMARMDLDAVMDVPIMFLNGMAFAVTTLCAVVILFRMLMPPNFRSGPIRLAAADVTAMTRCAGFVFAASAMRYLVLAMMRVGAFDRMGFEYEFSSAMCDFAIVLASLSAIYYATRGELGYRAVAVWAMVATAVGAVFALIQG